MSTNSEEALSRAFEKALKNTFWMVVFFIILTQTFDYFIQGHYKKDDTDSHDSRSGMMLRTDNATGCQYLETQRGGITPRLNGDGSHRGCYRK